MSVKFKISDKLVKERDGETYSLDKYTLGTDYVIRKCFKSHKAVFRSDILGISVVDPSKVEHKQEPKSLNLEISEPTVDEWRQFDSAQQAKITKIYANFKWVETDKGRIWVGLKGQTLRVNQVIRIKDGQLYLKKV